jgi:hypothetical protein
MPSTKAVRVTAIVVRLGKDSIDRRLEDAVGYASHPSRRRYITQTSMLSNCSGSDDAWISWHSVRL